MTHRIRPPLVGPEHFELLVTTMAILRKKHGGHRDLTRTRRDMADALETLRLCGFTVLPKGWIDSFKNIIETIDKHRR